MTASFTPAGAAEFPNDNPALHRGVRWVCAAGRGPARAVWRAHPSALPEPEAPPRPQAPAATEPVVRHNDGPLELDLGRIVLLHRVEDVPPPPDFIYRPFVSSRTRAAPAPASPRPIHPRPCRVVDARQARLRVQRGWRVDVAPCLDIGVDGGAVERRPSRHRGIVVACPAPDLPAELQAASA